MHVLFDTFPMADWIRMTNFGRYPLIAKFFFQTLSIEHNWNEVPDSELNLGWIMQKIRIHWILWVHSNFWRILYVQTASSSFTTKNWFLLVCWFSSNFISASMSNPDLQGQRCNDCKRLFNSPGDLKKHVDSSCKTIKITWIYSMFFWNNIECRLLGMVVDTNDESVIFIW